MSPVPAPDIAHIVNELAQVRQQWRTTTDRQTDRWELPSPEVVKGIMQDLCGALFPLRLGPRGLTAQSENFYVGHTLNSALERLAAQIRLELCYVRSRAGNCEEMTTLAEDKTKAFAAELPKLRALLDTDVIAAYQGDPAATSVDEVLLCYPGVQAMIHHRIAHTLYRLDSKVLARIISEQAHSLTGIDIHPGATIGKSFFIDHGTGVVIGETCIIGERVRLYQAVTLGAVRFPASEAGELVKGLARHPVVEDDVVIYAGATVLGRITIGQGSVIGGNVWLTRDVPPGSHITQASNQSGIRNDPAFS